MSEYVSYRLTDSFLILVKMLVSLVGIRNVNVCFRADKCSSREANVPVAD